MPFLSDIAFTEPGLLRGHVMLDSQPERQWHVGLFVNDRLLTATFAALPSDMGEQAGWRRDHGFHFSLNLGALGDSDVLRIEVLNEDHVIIEQSLVNLRRLSGPAQQATGTVHYVSGLTLRGIVENGVTDLPSYEVFAMEGDRIVGRCRINRWEHVGDPKNPLGRAAAYDLHLDPDLADGRVHRLHVETSTGLVLHGSPVDVIAWPNRLRAGLIAATSGGTPAHARQAEFMLDRLLGLGMPMSAYAALYPELAVPTAPATPDGDIGQDGHWYRLGETGWALCCHKAVHPVLSFAARLAGALPHMQEPQAVFADLAVQQDDGAIWPLLMPAFDTERLLEQGHAALCFALPTSALSVADKAPSLISFLLDHLAPAGGLPGVLQLWHVPHPAGWARQMDLTASSAARGLALEAALRQPGRLPTDSQMALLPQRATAIFPALHLRRPILDRAVSVIVPTRDHGAMLKTAIDGLRSANPGFELDILVVDNGSTEPDTLEILNQLEDGGARVLEYGEGFNFSLINNLACEHAQHAQLCFMNNDVAFPWSGVLEELCSRMADPAVGAAGPVMVRASDIVQHGGVVLGPWHGAMHAFEDRMLGDPGYGELLCAAWEPAAVTGAFLLTRRALFEDLGGFDTTRFAVNFNDVDYCLRLRQAGYRIVLSPHARIRHFESVSRGREKGSPAGVRLHRELACLRTIWRDVILNDPQYHPLFAPDALPYRSLCVVHRDPAPRRAWGWRAADLPRWA